MAPDIERSVKNSPKSKLLTMDVRELTLLLKSIGFRLESIDYDDARCWHKKSNENGTASSATANSVRTDGNASTASIAATDQQHYINVEISCSKSKIVSNLSLRFNDCETTTAASSTTTTPTTAVDTQAHTTQAPDSPSRMIACSCPKREANDEQNSFWEVQSSGSFVNQRRSITSLINPDSQIDHDASSNLLPMLSTKSIALTNVLTQVLLNQYKNNTQALDTNDAAMDVDMKSILRTIENTNISSVLANEKGGNAGNDNVGNGSGDINVDDLNLITPMSSMNVTPTESAALNNDTVPKVTVSDQTTALNETVNTEAFGSPKSPFTSSPHSSENISLSFEREANVVDHLMKARQSIDHALLSMKSNITKNLTHDITAAENGMMSVKKASLSSDGIRKRTISQPQVSRMLNSRNTLQVTANARPEVLNRRASIGVSRLSTKTVASPAVSRLNSSAMPRTTATPVGGAAALSKVALVRKTASISSRISSMAASAKTTLLSATPTTTPSTSVKRPALVSRRTITTAKVTSGTPSIATGTAPRKTITASKLAVPSKIANK
ncbi:mucin-5AC-like [Contarinia nasturtii]|uniref:mucin-5AC-like n=1 Tax=Contarinia nasturtii TaxID=265458 RepID=UPI0012D416AE|nr:mucin-5AC-like [Contarinia nasturtii]